MIRVSVDAMKPSNFLRSLMWAAFHLKSSGQTSPAPAHFGLGYRARTCLLLLALTLFVTLPLSGQVPVLLMPTPKPQYFTQDGIPLAFGCVFSYEANTTTPLATYTDDTGTVQNTNPVILSAGGTASIWIQAGQAYTIKVVGAGGTNCASGSTQYTVDGISGGGTQAVTNVTYSTSPQFTVIAENQLFEITLTGDAASLPLIATGITPPAIVTWQITQDASGGHSFSWPSNTIGGGLIGSAANEVTTQMFIWNGSDATAIGPAVLSVGSAPAISVGDVFAHSLSLGGSQSATAFQGSAGTKLGTTSGTWINQEPLCSNATFDIAPCAANFLLANDTGTGTTVNTLTKLTGAPSTAVIAGAGDTGGVVGITVQGAGMSGSALVQQTGISSCVFDNATTAGDYAAISASVAGDCTDIGASAASSLANQLVGRVLVTNASPGTDSIALFPPESVVHLPAVVYSTPSAAVTSSISPVTMVTVPASGGTYRFSAYGDQTVLGASCGGDSVVVVIR